MSARAPRVGGRARSSPRRRAAGLVAALALVAAPGAQETEHPHDPMDGIDENGRIQRPELPDDLANPDRWRYTPPGRIAPGNVFERFLISSFFSPVIFRDGDVGTGGGVAVTDIDFRNQDYREFANILVTYTTEGQQNYGINWRRWLRHEKLPNGGIIREERSSIVGRVGYSKTLTRRFFGLGSRTPESAETSYTEELSRLGFGGRITVPDPGDDLVLEGGVAYQHHGLSSGHVEDVPSTEDDFPGLVAAGDSQDQLWVGFGIAYDTRDSLHQPYEGWRVGLSADTAVLQTGGDFGGLVELDAQGVVPLPPIFHDGGDAGEENPPTDVLALGGFVVDTHGDLPFYSLPSLGGTHTLRGFIDNRFTDRAAAHLSAEYRMVVVPRGFTITRAVRIERIGLGFFYDVGTVADGVEDLSDGRIHDSYGFGLRIGFAREATFRIDLGLSDEGPNLTIRFGNAF